MITYLYSVYKHGCRTISFCNSNCRRQIIRVSSMIISSSQLNYEIIAFTYPLNVNTLWWCPFQGHFNRILCPPLPIERAGVRAYGRTGVRAYGRTGVWVDVGGHVNGIDTRMRWWVGEWVDEWVDEWVGDWVSEWASERRSEWVSEWVTQSVSQSVSLSVIQSVRQSVRKWLLMSHPT